MSFEISLKAQKDLIGIWEFTFENWSLIQADSYYEMIIDKIREIDKNSSIGKSYESLRKGYRGASVKSHIVFYRIQDNGDIEVMRILHQRMDLENRLNE